MNGQYPRLEYCQRMWAMLPLRKRARGVPRDLDPIQPDASRSHWLLPASVCWCITNHHLAQCLDLLWAQKLGEPVQRCLTWLGQKKHPEFLFRSQLLHGRRQSHDHVLGDQDFWQIWWWRMTQNCPLNAPKKMYKKRTIKGLLILIHKWFSLLSSYLFGKGTNLKIQVHDKMMTAYFENGVIYSDA